MTPTEKHRETAEKVVNDFRMIGDGCEGDLMEMIAHALAKAEREGMKRAAEIARNHFDLRHADKARYASMAISSAILTEAGEDE